ncbi:MAG: xanthine dehydrogenase family protein molybdopterin-binding subunit [Chloroflexi bacterium]|nr:xanthine dehydrogenase family protein molybdopterin-binding subunit [Chloroflexota bacterium]
MSEQAMNAGGLTIVGEVAMGFPPPRTSYARAAYGNTEPNTQRATWLRIGQDGSVTAYAGKVEYGQGIRSGLAMEVADELRLPLAAVEVVLGDTDMTPWDMGTFGSQSTARVGLQLRKAAATAREALLELAADHLDLPVADLTCANGQVASGQDSRHSVSYGDLLLEKTIERDIVEDIELTPESKFTVMGTDAPRVDAVDRVTGKATYSQDIIVENMLYASVLRRPSVDAKLLDLDATAAEHMPGVRQVVRDNHLIAVLAETDEQAGRAAAVLQARWEEQEDRSSQLDLPALLKKSGGDPFTVQEAGSLEEGFREADELLEATYYIPYVSTVPMEPRAAVARWDGEKLTVWAGTQRPFGLRTELAGRFEIDENNVRVIAPEIGGGFGSKSLYPTAHEAARLAKVAGRPVRVAHTRGEEMQWGTVRPAALIEIKSGFKSDGTLVAWQFDAYHATNERPFIGRRGSETPYDAAHVKVTTFSSQSPLRVGSYRSLGGAVNHFAREVHMDEIAEATGIDPVELRLRNLREPRFRRVLETAADAFGWEAKRPPSKRGVGVAVGLDVGSYIATCVELDVRGTEVRVERVTAALDCGLTVNPEGARNQTEGGIVMGMGTALYEAVDFQAGRVLTAGFARYRVPRINNAPQIETLLVGDPETPSTGAGEPGIVPIAAAISNAVFDLTGERHRELPIQRHLR